MPTAFARQATPAPTTVSQTPGTPVAQSTAIPATPGIITRVPTNRAELRALPDQLTSAANRRRELAQQLANTTGPSRSGIEDRLRVLDNRIVNLERDIASTGQLVTAARGLQSVAGTPSGIGGRMDPDVIVPVIGMLSVFVFFPLVIAYARGLWKRGSAVKVETELERANAERLSRLENAVDSIAV